MSLQGWAVALVLALAGYAWHDRLGGRFPRAGRWALLGLLAAGLVLALLNADVEFAAFAFAAAPALGWSLRRGHARPFALRLDVPAGLAYVALATGVAAAWSPAFVAWGFVVGASLVALRVAVVDPLLAWRARRAAPQGDSING